MGSGGYPYDEKLKKKDYEKRLLELQLELIKLQDHIQKHEERLVVLFEGRDASGKGSCISRFLGRLNPRHARSVALSKPTDTERGEWYFQRYVCHLPTQGDIVLFDRSWYNRAGVERVMGFCTEEQTSAFLRDAPDFEALLVRDGIRFFKLFLVIGREMQLKRFHERRHDPLQKVEDHRHRSRCDQEVGRLLGGAARHLPLHAHDDRAMDGDPCERPAARAAGGDPRGAVGDPLRRQGRGCGRQAGPADRRLRP